jgi:two-component system cell cycle response regulator DivK
MTTALVIDDNDMNLAALEQLLKRENVTPYMAASPTDVPAILETVDAIDVVFLDLEFPNYDGLTVINDLKALPKLANAPFVAYTVHISELNEARTAGFHSFIGKPLNVSAFPDQLARILNGERVWDVSQ